MSKLTRLHSACMPRAVEVEFAERKSALGSQLSKPCDDHAPIYALHCLSIYVLTKTYYE
jgi:hypothetical protein